MDIKKKKNLNCCFTFLGIKIKNTLALTVDKILVTTEVNQLSPIILYYTQNAVCEVQEKFSAW